MPHPTRRHWLQGLGAGALCALHTPLWAATRTVHLAAAWQQADGSYRAGVLRAARTAGAPLTVVHAIDIPTRAHALLVQPDGALVIASRRPGDWLLHWTPGSTTEPQWQWMDGTRTFNGHVIASPDGRHVLTTESDAETGASLVALRDVRSLETVAEWSTHGIDAHELIWAPAIADHTGKIGTTPTLIVANGGVPTAPETGRIKRNLERMDSSLVRLDGQSGALQGQWRLEDPRVSLRHLAWNATRSQLGIALQAEHDTLQAKRAAPVLALFDGQRLRTAHAPADITLHFQGYGGTMAATPDGWAVSCPRANGIATFTPSGAWRALVPLTEGYALTRDGEGQLWAGGRGQSLQAAFAPAPNPHPHAPALDGAQLDNHWFYMPA